MTKYDIIKFIINLQKMIQPHLSSSLKSFIFQNELTYQSENMEISIPNSVPEIDIRHIIDSFKQRMAMYLPLQWKIYDPQLLMYKKIDVEKPLNQIFFFSPVVMFKYREIGLPDSDCDSLNNSKADSETKKERNKERTIKEVVQCVKRWRQIHNTLDKYRNKVNLYDAARAVGIAKKSLDDYYCQLRLAEEYGFDFQRNFHEKIGVLRSFVRKNRPKGQISAKHQRLPKKLRIIQDFIPGSGSIKKQIQQKIEMMQQQLPNQTVGIIESQYQPPLEVIPQDQLQHKFLSSFNFMIDDPNDPFINYGYMRTNSNKISQIDSSDFLFF